MTAQDAVDATQQATKINAKGKALQLQAKHQEQEAAQQRAEQAALLNSFWAEE